MGRTAYEAMAGAVPTADHPFTAYATPGRHLAHPGPSVCVAGEMMGAAGFEPATSRV